MAVQQKVGNRGEKIASDYLIKEGYKILEQNWRFRQKEIDIIAEKDNFIVVVEVKSRSVGFKENPMDAVNLQKQKFLIKAANAYINRYYLELEVRFDIITVVFQNEHEYKLKHIEDAFYPTLRH